MRLLSLALGISTSIIVLPTILFTRKRILCKAESKSFPARIAIIGSGIGGSASTHFTRQLFGSSAAIDVYEASDRIGGRLDTIEVAGKWYEAGGSIIHPDNMHMQEFVRDLGLKKLKSSEPNALLGIYNGTAFEFLGSRWKILNYAKLLWQYGFDLVVINILVKKMLKNFSNIYTLQKDGKSFSSVPELLTAMGGEEFTGLTQKTTREVLEGLGLKKRTIDELVTSVMRINYGQDVTLNAFAGSVSLAGIGGGLWSVEGGNWKVCEGLLAVSKATLYKETKITEISKMMASGTNTRPAYILTNNNGQQKSYDVVIVAAPLAVHSYYLPCQNCSNWPEPSAPGTFWQTVATFFSSEVNYKHFGFASIDEFPEVVGSTENPRNYFNSIGAQEAIKDRNSSDLKRISVRKVFSRAPLTTQQKNELFPQWNAGESKTVAWLAYPNLKPAEHFSSFVLDDGVFYVNAIEYAASAMEMSAVGAKNAALLAFQYFTKQQLEHKAEDASKNHQEL